MNRACLSILAAMSFSCGGVSNAVDELATVEVGTDALPVVQFERSVTLGVDRLPGCLDFSVTLPSSTTMVALANTADGCALTVAQPDLVLIDEQAIERAREQSGPFDVSGIRSGSIELQKLELATAEGAPLSLADYVDALSIQLDSALLLDRVAPSELQGDAQLTRELPSEIIDELKASLTNDQPATAHVVLTLWLRDSRTELPETVKLLLVLQPQLEVNVVDAAL
jgi:hypothetical protein